MTAGGVAYLIKQGFEGSGYDNSESWTTQAGDPDPDSTNNAFEGTQTLEIDATLDAALSPLFTPQTEVWLYFTMYITALPSTARTVARFQSADGATTRAYMDLGSAGLVRIFYGSGSANSTPFTASINTRYHIWLRFVEGSGTGIIQLYHATTDTRPGSVTDQTLDGTGAGTVGAVLMGNNGATQGMTVNFDKIRVDDVEIGSAPE